MIPTIFFLSLAGMAAVIIYQDIKTLTISAVTIYAFTLVCVIMGLGFSHPGLSAIEHTAAGLIAGLLSFSIREILSRAKGVEALGEADVWLMAASGFLLGPTLLGPWMMISSALAAFIMLTGIFPGSRRRHPDNDAAAHVIPLTPVLLATMLVTEALVLAGLLPADHILFL